MSSITPEKLIQNYQLQPHPEGGYFFESYRSKLLIETPFGKRSACTAIYFLLNQGDISHFHRIKSDELWHFYHGGPLEIHEINESGNFHCTILSAENPQYIVMANRWFASRPAIDSDYSFVGCTVSPGFDFSDFEMAKKNELIALYPDRVSLLDCLCLD